MSDPKTTDELPERCPECGAATILGFGLAGGGYGPYVVCDECDFSSPRLRLVDRLRGIYTVPVNDGAGLLDGKDTFTPSEPFFTPPVQKEAAERIELLEAAYADAISALRYIRLHHGDLYGVGWARLDDTHAEVWR